LLSLFSSGSLSVLNIRNFTDSLSLFMSLIAEKLVWDFSSTN